MSVELLDHEAARFAHGCVTQRFGALTTLTDDFKKYRSALLSAGPTIRQMGLLQTAAFWNANDTDGFRGLMEDVFGWFAASKVAKAAWPSSAVNGDPLARLFDRDSAQLAVLEMEADRVIGFLKRLVEGRKHVIEARNAQPGGAEQSNG